MLIFTTIINLIMEINIKITLIPVYLKFPFGVSCLITLSASEAISSMRRTQFSFDQHMVNNHVKDT